MRDPGSAFVLRPGEGRSVDLGNFAMSVKATAAETGGAFSLLEATEPADSGPRCTSIRMRPRPSTF